MARIAFGSPEALAVLEADKAIERMRREAPDKLDALYQELEEVKGEIASCENRLHDLGGERDSIIASIKKLERFMDEESVTA